MYHRNYQLLTLPSILLHRGLSYRNASTYRCIVTPLVVLQSLFCMSVKQPMSANRPMSLDGRTSGNGPKMRLLSVNQPMLLNLPLIPDLLITSIKTSIIYSLFYSCLHCYPHLHFTAYTGGLTPWTVGMK